MPPSKNISFEELSQYFHLPINQVAKELGVCATILKKTCRRNGIPRWPHRKIKSLDNRIANLQVNLEKNPQDQDEIHKEIELLRTKKNEIMKHPDILVRSAQRSEYTGPGKAGKANKYKSSNYDDDDDEDFSPQSPGSGQSTPSSSFTQSTQTQTSISNPPANFSSNSTMLNQYYSQQFLQAGLKEDAPAPTNNLNFLSNPPVNRMDSFAFERFMNATKSNMESPAPYFQSSSSFQNLLDTTPSGYPNISSAMQTPNSLFSAAPTGPGISYPLPNSPWTVSTSKTYPSPPVTPTPAPHPPSPSFNLFSNYSAKELNPYHDKYSSMESLLQHQQMQQQQLQQQHMQQQQQQQQQQMQKDERLLSGMPVRSVSEYLAMARATGMMPNEMSRMRDEFFPLQRNTRGSSDMLSVTGSNSTSFDPSGISNP